MRRSRALTARTCVTLFVNPTQFGPNEDLAVYPRTEQADAAMLAAEGADSVLRVLDGSGTVSFLEPLEGRRAFALSADAEGVRTLVQLRGERVEQVIRWQQLATPQAFGEFVGGLAPQDADPDALAALCTVYGAAALAERMHGWDGVPDTAEAGDFAAQAEAWQRLAPRGPATAPPAAMTAELEQFARVAALARALSESDSYLALQRAREAMQTFGLLAAWLSDGGSRWQYQP